MAANVGRAVKVHKTVDHYKLDPTSILGTGGFGTVYLGRNTLSNEAVAVKFVNPPPVVGDHVTHIMRELEILSTTQHPNIVRLLHLKEIDACYYLVLELCKCDLDTFASKNEFSLALKLFFIQDIAAAVGCLHGNNMLHRDIKPMNILVKEEEHGALVLKLTDFGLSRKIPEGIGSMSFSGSIVGTLSWMSPEVAEGFDPTAPTHNRYNKPSDIYSSGLVFRAIASHDAPGNLNPKSESSPVSCEDAEVMRLLHELIDQMVQRVPTERCKIQRVKATLESLTAAHQLATGVTDRPTLPPQTPPPGAAQTEDVRSPQTGSSDGSAAGEFQYPSTHSGPSLNFGTDESPSAEALSVAWSAAHQLRYPATQSGPSPILGTDLHSAQFSQAFSSSKQIGTGPTYRPDHPPKGGNDAPSRNRDLPSAVASCKLDNEKDGSSIYSSPLTTTPPSAFDLNPLDVDAPLDHEPAPTGTMSFTDVQAFEEVDKHAVKVTTAGVRSFRDLMWLLIYARNISNDLEKARAIFTWICFKDVSTLKFERVENSFPEDILTRWKNKQTRHAVVFETLCRYARLHCKSLIGYAKGADYKPGMRFTKEQNKHAWNAVLVEDTWRLVDCYQAARRGMDGTVTVDEFFFMANPQHFIYTHFPDDSLYQLLESPISITDFENMVHVNPAFFKQGLQTLSHQEAIIRTQGDVIIRIGCPPARADTLDFTFSLTYADSSSSDSNDFHGTHLDRFGMQWMADNVSCITIRVPQQGNFWLVVYAKELTDKMYGNVCQYQLQCTRPVPSPHPFPPCSKSSWGANASASKFGLVPGKKGAIISTEKGQVDVRFQLKKMLRFNAKLKKMDKDDKTLAPYILHRIVDKEAIFTVIAPSPGEYGLEIYANDPITDGKILFHIYQYLLTFKNAGPDAVPPPVLPPGYLGPQTTYQQLGLSEPSHPDPYVEVDGRDLTLSFTMQQRLHITSQFLYVSEGGQQETNSDYVLHQAQASTIIFQLRLKQTGFYRLEIFALPYSDNSGGLPNVFNYLINCQHGGNAARGGGGGGALSTTTVPFPKQYEQWTSGSCFLHVPKEGVIHRAGATSLHQLPVRVAVPMAISVAIVIVDDWTQLEQREGPDRAWEGSVSLDQHWGKGTMMKLCAKYNESDRYSRLLEYTIAK